METKCTRFATKLSQIRPYVYIKNVHSLFLHHLILHLELHVAAFKMHLRAFRDVVGEIVVLPFVLYPEIGNKIYSFL